MENASFIDSGPEVQSLLDVLAQRGAVSYEHSGRTLKDHLRGVCDILAAWDQPAMLYRAGLFHSCYSTDVYPYALYDLSERPEVRRLIGPEAEERAYLFCVMDRRDFLRQLAPCAQIPEDKVEITDLHTGQRRRLNRSVVADLLVMEMANSAEQTMCDDASPGHWMATAAHSGLLVRDVLPSVPPVFGNCTAELSKADEDRARQLYLQGESMLASDPGTAAIYLTEACRLNPWVAEPGILLALIDLQAGRRGEAMRRAGLGTDLLLQWRTAWDKRKSWAEWMNLTSRIKKLSGDFARL